MSDWLVKLAAQETPGITRLVEALGNLPIEELQEFTLEAGYSREPLRHMEAFQQKLAFAEDTGRELAHKQTRAEKHPFADDVARGMGAGGLAGVGSAILGAHHSGTLKSHGPNVGHVPLGFAVGAAAGALSHLGRKWEKHRLEKRAGLGGNLMSMGQKAIGAAKPLASKALGFAAQKPTAALAIGGGALGAVGGAISGGKDHRLSGAVTGGLIGAGAGAGVGSLSSGARNLVSGGATNGLSRMGQGAAHSVATPRPTLGVHGINQATDMGMAPTAPGRPPSKVPTQPGMGSPSSTFSPQDTERYRGMISSQAKGDPGELRRLMSMNPHLFAGQAVPSGTLVSHPPNMAKMASLAYRMNRR